MDKPHVRWGILGSANIAQKNWKAIWNSQNGRISAVASRSRARSERFIAECQAHTPYSTVPRALGSYEELLAAEDVDAVYIPLPTGLRGQWVKRAAEAGKHVVCEKPCATSVVELSEMLAACRRNGVQFMDGVMFMHSERLKRMRAVLDDGKTVGEIRRISSAFSFRGDEEFFAGNIRAQSELEPDGCLGDLGWYCIRFALWAMRWELPQRVSGQVLSEIKHASSRHAVPTEFSAELHFKGGVSSSLYCSFVTETEQWANVSGTSGWLGMPDYVLPFSGPEIAFQTGNPVFKVQGCDFEMQPHIRRWVVEESSHSAANAQESRLYHTFDRLVQSGKVDSFWPEIALKTQVVMEACRESAAKKGQLVEVDATRAQ